jgi:hypothetical protein
MNAHCTSCGAMITPTMVFCGGCGSALSNQPQVVQANSPSLTITALVNQKDKPLPGIIVAVIVSILFLLVSLANATQIAVVTAGISSAFPSLALLYAFNELFWKLVLVALLVGSLLSFCAHPWGSKVVGIASVAGILSCLGGIMLTFTSYLFASDVHEHPELYIQDATPKEMIFSILTSVVIGNVFAIGIMVLILFLFRRHLPNPFAKRVAIQQP